MPVKTICAVFLISFPLASSAGETSVGNLEPVPPWWATECDLMNPASGAIAFATFRNFPVSVASIDHTAERKLTLSGRGMSIASEQGHAVFQWNEVTKVRFEKIGTANPAYSLSIFTTKGAVLNGPFGVVELSCLRKLETLLSRYAAGSEVGSPPPADIRFAPHEVAGAR